MLDKIALVLSVLGAINWGVVGLFSFDAIAWISGGPGSMLARILYVVVGVAGLWCVSLLFRENEVVHHHRAV